MTAVAGIVTTYIHGGRINLHCASHQGASLQNWEVASPLAPGNATVVWGLVWSMNDIAYMAIMSILQPGSQLSDGQKWWNMGK